MKKDGAKTTEVSHWSTETAVSQQTTGTASASTDKKTKPAGIKAGNGKTGQPAKPTIDTIEFSLPGADVGNTGTTKYHITIDASKLTFPKAGYTWQGVVYANTPQGKADFLVALNAEIRIENGKAVISGLPAGLKFTFNVHKVEADGSLSMATQVAATTAKYAATKIAAVKAQTMMTSVTLNPTPPKTLLDGAFDDICYRIVMSYVTGSGKAKVTNWVVLEINKDGSGFRVLDADVAGTQVANGFKASLNAAYITDADVLAGLNVDIEDTFVSNKVGNRDCLVITGLSPSTKYAFAMQTVATDVNGSEWRSAVGKTSVTTVKFTAPTKVKATGIDAATNSLLLQWNVSMKLPAYSGSHVEYQFMLADSKGNPAIGAEWLTATDVSVPPAAKGIVTGTLALPEGTVAAANTKYTVLVRAVTNDTNLDGGACVESLLGRAMIKTPK